MLFLLLQSIEQTHVAPLSSLAFRITVLQISTTRGLGGGELESKELNQGLNFEAVRGAESSWLE